MICKAIYLFRKKPGIVKAWALDLVLDRKNIYKLPTWVQIHGLDAKYPSASSLSKLRSVLLKPIKATQDKDKIVYAHILVEVLIEGTIYVTTELVNEKAIVMQQAVHYE